MSVPFTPGAFEPVITTTLQPGQPPFGVHVSYDGFLDFTEETYSMARNASQGRGSNADFTVASNKQAAKVVGHLLAARSICEQYQAVEKKMPKVANALTRPVADIPEPLAKAYNYFGHFDIDGKVYSAFDLEQKLTYHLVHLSKYATEGLANLEDDFTPTSKAKTSDVLYSRFGINAAGEMCCKARTVLSEHVKSIVKNIMDTSDATCPTMTKIALCNLVTSIGSEYGLPSINALLKEHGVKIPSRDITTATPENHTSALKSIFGVDDFPTTNGAVLKTSVVLSKITLAFRILNMLTDAHRASVKIVRVPKYESGSKAQLACVNKESGQTTSPVSLSLSELTFAAACLPSTAPSRMFCGTILDEPALVRLTLIRNSMRHLNS
jgi:hypothetical protein